VWNRFPNPVNETSARLVAAGVVLMGLTFLVTASGWVLIPLVFGFAARVLAGPTFSPLARLATQVITPRLDIRHRFTPGAPKRFAQGIGLAFSGGAALSWAVGASGVTYVLITGLVTAAFLEAAFAVCLGCIAFNRLMRWGVIPASVCEECADISDRLAAATR
jgi:Domain of unknown function (DUF4395)